MYSDIYILGEWKSIEPPILDGRNGEFLESPTKQIICVYATKLMDDMWQCLVDDEQYAQLEKDKVAFIDFDSLAAEYTISGAPKHVFGSFVCQRGPTESKIYTPGTAEPVIISNAAAAARLIRT